MTELKGKWLVVTNKACKPQVKREAERILKGVTLHIMINPIYNQPITTAKEHRNPTLVHYAVAVQAAAENEPEITNVATPRQSKRNCIVLFDALNTESYPTLLQKKQNYFNKQEDQENNLLSNETTTTWREELQETLVENTKLLKEKSDTNTKEVEVQLNNTLNATLKEFQGMLLREVATKISTQIKKKRNKITASIDNAINARQNQNYIYPADNYPPLTPNDIEIIVNTITPDKSSKPITGDPTPVKYY